MKIIRDTREKDQHGWSFGEIETIDQKLDTGDYTLVGLEDIICIERKKSPSEVAINIGSDRVRFNKELERMKSFKLAYIICEFSLESLISFPKGSNIPKSLQAKVRVGGKFLLSTLNSYKDKYNIDVLFCNNRDEAIEKSLELFGYAQEIYGN